MRPAPPVARGRAATALPRIAGVDSSTPTTSWASPRSPLGSPRVLLEARSQSPAFQTPRRQCEAPGDHPGGRTPSPISCVLRTFGHVARGFSPRAASYVQESPPGVVTARSLARFRGAENTSSPLPLNDGVSRFGTVSECPHQQALRAPFMVELFTVAFSRAIAEACHRSGRACHHARAPHAGRVART